jgi:HAD superfamily hydrolase (TIGR01484 family)
MTLPDSAARRPAAPPADQPPTGGQPSTSPPTERPPAGRPATDRLRPLAELPADRLRAAHGVLTDIDDTLTRDGAIEAEALAALHALAAAGVPVIAITGRPAGWSEPFALAWPVAAIVAENGGVMLRRNAAGGLRRDFATDAATRDLHGRRLQACADAVLAEVPGARLATDSAGRLTDIAIDHSEFSQLDEAQIAQVVAVMQRHGLTATVSSIHVNGWLGDHSKWTAARWAVEQVLGVAFEPAQWLYVGDSTNDQLMFERVPLSVGVANIARFLPQLTVFPPWVAEAERGVGFAEVAAALLAARSTL